MSKHNTEPLIGEILRRCADPCAWAPDGQILGAGRYTTENAPYETLLSPARIGSLQLKNRCLIAAPGGDGTPIAPDARLRRFYLDRARAGIALFTTPPVSDFSRADPQPIQHWLSLNEALHATGARILFQIRLDGAKPQQAAALAAAAAPGGFDGICLHAREHDEAVEEALRLIKERTGKSFPVLLRLSLSDSVEEGGAARDRRSMSGQLELLLTLAAAGADAFEIGLGGKDSPWLTQPSSLLPSGCFAEAARAAKAHLQYHGLNLPVIAFGNLSYPDLDEELLRSGRCDLISLDGAGIDDADWLRKVRTARSADIRPAPLSVRPVEPASSVAVIGAGIRGMDYAIRAADAGCRVDLFDEMDTVGGKLSLYRSRYAYEKENLVRYLLRQIGEREAITLRLRTKADAELLKYGCYDRIVFACSPAAYLPPNIPGWASIPFLSPEQLSPEAMLACKRKRIVVLGHDLLACDLALALRCDYGAKRVVLVTDRPAFMSDCESADHLWMLRRLEKSGCRLFTDAEPEKIHLGSLFVNAAAQEKAFAFRCQLIVLADRKPAPLPLYRECVEQKIAGDVMLL